jgi:flagellar motor switch protein FliM
LADVLDQSEVDALLAAVDSGQVAQEPAPNIFGSNGASQVSVQIYDFKRPERVSKDQMRALEGLHEGFGRNFGAAISGYLRTIIEVSVAHIEQLTYSEFIHSLPNPTCFNLLKAEQLDGQLCLEISPLIIYPIIDRLLGGSNADLFIPQRPLTQIEQRLVQRITDRATHHLSEAWSNLTPVTFSVQDFESNPQLVQIVPPNETVVVVGFELKMGNRAGTMDTRRGTLVLISCASYASFSSLSSSSASTGHAASTPAPAAWRSSGAIAPCHVAARASGSVAHSPASVDRFAD